MLFPAVVSNIVPVLENIVAAIPEVLNTMLDAIADLLPMLDTITKLFDSVLTTLLELLR